MECSICYKKIEGKSHKYNTCSEKCRKKYLWKNNINRYRTRGIQYKKEYEKTHKEEIARRKHSKYSPHPRTNLYMKYIIHRKLLTKEEKNERKKIAQKKWIKNKYVTTNYYRKSKQKTYIPFLLRNRLTNALKYYKNKGIFIKSRDKRINYHKAIKYLIKTLPKDYEPGKYHIDHIMPLSKFDLTNKEEITKAFDSSNLRWLLAKENYQKRDKIIPIINF